MEEKLGDYRLRERVGIVEIGIRDLLVFYLCWNIMFLWVVGDKFVKERVL